MRAEYALVRELKPYSLAEVADRLSCDQSQIQEILGRLLASGVVRYRTRGDQYESEIADEAEAVDDECYQFRYVGIVIVEQIVIVCYPKYIRREGGPTENELQQMVRVLRKLDGYGELPYPQGDAAWSNELSVIVRLLQLYDEHGTYSNFEETRELNGASGMGASLTETVSLTGAAPSIRLPPCSPTVFPSISTIGPERPGATSPI